MNRLSLTAVLCLCASGNVIADESAKKCGTTWHVRDRLSDTGIVKTPAKLALEHSAGSETFGSADVALLLEGACDSGSTSEFEYAFGADYHRNTSEKSAANNANIGGNLRYWWSSAPARTQDAIVNNLHLSLSAGRNIEADTQTRALALSFESYDENGSGFWPFGIEREGLVYSAQPKIEYFYGYQPKDLSGARNATFATAALGFDWAMQFSQAVPTIHLFGSWTGRARIAGDDALPHTADVGSAGMEFEFLSQAAKQRAGVALTYDVGKQPDSGFVHDEVVRLVFTFLFDS